MKFREPRWYSNNPKLRIALSVIFLINLLAIIFHKKIKNSEKIDWNDYKNILLESKRKGFGENGDLQIFKDQEIIQKSLELSEKLGVSVAVSDRISVNRALPDPRILQCIHQKYLKFLPSVSIVIAFQDELLSIFKRTLNSIYKRTPHQLIKEIILVNDNSTTSYKELFDFYIPENFQGVDFSVVDLPVRVGLIQARNFGAKVAIGEILCFLDAHVEVNWNWLPPLIEPLIKNSQTVTVPIIDLITHNNFKFIAKNASVSMEIFDWDLDFQLLLRSPSSNYSQTVPASTPIMNGAVFLIRRDYFFKLGGYDEDLKSQQAAKLEMSFKIHLCGGILLEVPCSRVAKVYKHLPRNENDLKLLIKDKKRVAEVWMKNHKSYVYERNPEFNKVDPGDLSQQHIMRAKCKPFKYFLDVVVPEMKDLYPFDPPQFAYGIVRLDKTEKCIDTLQRPVGESLGMYNCDLNSAEPRLSQDFELTYFRDIRIFNSNVCLDSHLITGTCHQHFGNQRFEYDLMTKHIHNGNEFCLEVNRTQWTLRMANCDKSNVYQNWVFGVMDFRAIRNFDQLARVVRE